MKIEFDNRIKIVIASKSGTVNVSEIIRLINTSVALGIKHKCYCILFNMTKVEEIYSFMEEYKLNQNLINLTDLTYDHHCAVVYTPSKFKTVDELQFKERVAVNWGQGIFKIFIDLEEAIEWLKQHTTKKIRQ